MRFAIRVLGPLEVTDDERLINCPPQARHVLGLLAAADGQWVPGGLLELELWPDAAPRSPKAALQVAISKVRRLFDPLGAEILESRDGSYRIGVAHCTIDLHDWFGEIERAQRAAAAGRVDESIQRFETVRRLWAGEPFANIVGSEHLESERRRLEQVRTDADLDEARVLLAARRPGDSARMLAATAEREPLREDVAITLMTGLGLSGRAAEALTLAAEFRTSLREQLGASPSESFEQAERELFGGALGASESQRPQSRPVLWRRELVEQLIMEVLDSLTRRTGTVVVVRAPHRFGLSALLAGVAGELVDRLSDADIHHLHHGRRADHSMSPVFAVAGATPGATEQHEHSLALDEIVNRAELKPQLFVIDDGQDLDPWSRRLIDRIQQRGVPQGVLLLVGLHDTADEQDSWLHDSEAFATLGRLERRDIERMLRDGDPSLSPAALRSGARRILDWCGGEPRWVVPAARALLLAGVDAELPSPPSATEHVNAQLLSLDVETRDLVGVAAVLGAPVDGMVLAAVTGQSTEEVTARLGLAAARDLVVRHTRPGLWAFPDRLTRQIVAADAPVGDPRQLHLRAANWLLDHHTGSARAARHLVEALPLVDPSIAAAAALEGGHELSREGRYDEATFLFESAAALAPTRQDGDPARLLRAAALERIGAVGLADELYNEIHGRCDETTPDLLAAAALGGAGHSNRIGGQPNRRARLVATRRLLDPSHPRAAEIVAELGHELLTSRNLPLDEDLRSQLVAISADDGSTGQLAAARLLLGIAELEAGASIDDARSLVSLIRSPAREVDGRHAGGALGTAVYVAMVRGHWQQADEWIAELEFLGRSVGSPKSRWLVPVYRAALADGRGHAKEADVLAEDGFDVGRELDIPDAATTWGLHHMARAFRHGSLAPFASEIRDVGERYRRAVFFAICGLAEHDLGNEGAAIEQLDLALEELEHGFDVHRPPAVALTCLLAARLDRPARTAAVVHELDGRTGGMVMLGYGGPFLGPVDWFLAEYATAAGDPRSAAFRQAAVSACKGAATAWTDPSIRR